MQDQMLQFVVFRDSAGYAFFVVFPDQKRNLWPPNIVFIFCEPIGDSHETLVEALKNAEEAVKSEAKRRGIPHIGGLQY